MVCIYLATKVTEEPRKQRDIINVGYKLEHPESEFLSVNSTTLGALRRSLTQGELLMMRALGFDFNVELPHVWITSIIYGMAWWERNGVPPVDMETVDIRIKRIAQAAWRIANKVVECGLVDIEPSRLLGAACLAIAMRFCKEKLPAKDDNEWAEIWANASGRQLIQIKKLIEKSTDLSLVLSCAGSNMSGI
ncbi:hypothetical protein LPJ73_009271 [Coemansia sp. RSA 2703]|nr:hypothetical protein LPJ73_009271 [Coemansia sp. RSA 2703]